MNEKTALLEMKNSVPTDIIIDTQNTIEDISMNIIIENMSLLEKQRII